MLRSMNDIFLGNRNNFIMKLPSLLAAHFRQVNFGGNWTWVNLKETLKDITWEQATTKLDSLNTIAMLAYHINYYVVAITKVLQGNPMEAHDKYSFDCPPIQNEEDWEKMKEKIFAEAETLAGLIEHTHYHLGQIVIIKKLLAHR